jgi:hypothetical protein
LFIRGEEEYDVIIYFDIESYTRGCCATWHHPAEGPEFEFSFVRAEMDGAPGELTAAEQVALMAWFYANHGKACERARDAMNDF